MKTELELKEIVKAKYSEIALQDKETNMSSCCGAGGCSTEVYNIISCPTIIPKWKVMLQMPI
jgi:hypothetical protein